MHKVISQVLREMDLSNPKTYQILEKLFQSNTVDFNFKSGLRMCLLTKEYDIARLILKHSKMTDLQEPMLYHELAPDDIMRVCYTRTARNQSIEDFPTLISTIQTSDTLVAVLEELPTDFEIDRYFIEALMHREHPEAIVCAVERFSQANRGFATDVACYILSCEADVSFDILDRVLPYYTFDDDGHLLLDFSATKNFTIFSKVIESLDGADVLRAWNTMNNKTNSNFLRHYTSEQQHLLREYVEQLNSLEQRKILTDTIEDNSLEPIAAHTRKI